MKTFELSNTKRDGTLVNVTFIKAESMEEAEKIAEPCWCTGVKVLTEVPYQKELFSDINQ